MTALPTRLLEVAAEDGHWETVRRLADARVVFMDHDRVVDDFPWMSDLRLRAWHPAVRDAAEDRVARTAQDVREAWLLWHCAVISETQADQTIVNSEIPTSGRLSLAYRPPRYGRALVLEALQPPRCRARTKQAASGLVDVKGLGVAAGVVPHFGDHGNGLLPLSEAFDEYAFNQLLGAVFKHSGSRFTALPCYAVLDLGFDLKMEDRPRAHFAAGAYVRRAHRRLPGGRELPRLGSPEYPLFWEGELLLRQYGITSATSNTFVARDQDRELSLEYREEKMPTIDPRILQALVQKYRQPDAAEVGPLRFSGINLQSTAEAIAANRLEIVDFGHFEAHRRFQDILLCLVANRPLMWGADLAPGSPHYVQPDPALAIPERLWGWRHLSDEDVASLGYPAGYNPFTEVELLGIELAKAYREGALTGCEVHARLRRLIDESTRHWPPAFDGGTT